MPFAGGRPGNVTDMTTPEGNEPSERELELAELRDGGPTRTPGMRTTTGGTAGPASVAEQLREHRDPSRAEEEPDR